MILPNGTLFPQAFLPLRIFEDRYRRMLQDSLASHRTFAVAMQKPGSQRESPVPVACLGLIRAAVTASDGTSHLILQGLARVALSKPLRYKPYRLYETIVLQSETRDNAALDVLTTQVLEVAASSLEQPASGALNPELSASEVEWMGSDSVVPTQNVELLAEVRSPGQLADLVSWTLLSDPGERQTLLETLDVETRLRRLIHFLLAERHRKRNNPHS